MLLALPITVSAGHFGNASSQSWCVMPSLSGIYTPCSGVPFLDLSRASQRGVVVDMPVQALALGSISLPGGGAPARPA